MPHSSGGGSHGGGSHGGGSHGGGSHGGGSGSSSRVSSHAFAGAKRYVYYQNHRPVYVYSNYELNKKQTLAEKLMLLIFLVPFTLLPPIITIFDGGIARVKPLDMDYNTAIVIEDDAGILGDTTELEYTLEQFRDTTGITPAVQTLNNEDWKSNYVSLENYAYERYLLMFDDEKHWLIVYSEPENVNPEFIDWYWEGMQGDETDPIITKKFADEGVKIFHDNLLMTNASVNKSLVDTFSSLSVKAKDNMGIHIEWGLMGFSLIWVVFCGYYTLESFGLTPKARRYRQAVACPTIVKEDTCEYCGGTYVVGTCVKCPHCAAPVKPHEYEKMIDEMNNIEV